MPFRLHFLSQFLASPFKTGAIIESSEELAHLITQSANLASAKCIVELGSGTGIFTEKIVKKIKKNNPPCDFFALELNPYFLKKTKERCPTAKVYHDNAKNIQKYLKQKQCDLIISGLPFANFPILTQEKIIGEIKKSLSEQGEFRTFAYLQGLLFPPGRNFKKLLKENFSSVRKTRIVWKNIPPAFVYVCKK